MTFWQAMGIGLIMGIVGFLTGAGLAAAATRTELADKFTEVYRRERAIAIRSSMLREDMDNLNKARQVDLSGRQH